MPFPFPLLLRDYCVDVSSKTEVFLVELSVVNLGIDSWEIHSKRKHYSDTRRGWCVQRALDVQRKGQREQMKCWLQLFFTLRYRLVVGIGSIEVLPEERWFSLTLGLAFLKISLIIHTSVAIFVVRSRSATAICMVLSVSFVVRIPSLFLPPIEPRKMVSKIITFCRVCCISSPHSYLHHAQFIGSSGCADMDSVFSLQTMVVGSRSYLWKHTSQYRV